MYNTNANANDDENSKTTNHRKKPFLLRIHFIYLFIWDRYDRL